MDADHQNPSWRMVLDKNDFSMEGVIDCVAYMRTLQMAEKDDDRTCWYLPSKFSQMMMEDTTWSVEDMVDKYFSKDRTFVGSLSTVKNIHIPINDNLEHWFCVIIDINTHTVTICDSLPTAESDTHRMDLVTKLVKRLEKVFMKWDNGEAKTRFNSTLLNYEKADWVPIQQNTYDCGLYVCMLMLLGNEFNAPLSNEQSIIARKSLALNMYNSPHNMIRYPDDTSDDDWDNDLSC